MPHNSFSFFKSGIIIFFAEYEDINLLWGVVTGVLEIQGLR